MRVFLTDLEIFSEINRKEEITEHTFLLTDQEEANLRACIEGEGKWWIETYGSFKELKWSTPKPNSFFDWNEEKRDWVLNQAQFNAVKAKKQNEVWENIKNRRTQANAGGVFLSSVGKHFHTDPEALINYSSLKQAIDFGYFEEVLWKTIEGDFVTMTLDLFKELSREIFATGQHNFKVGEQHRLAMLGLDDPYTYESERNR